ncbi:MAG: hypothetical protein EHM47_12990 [Ignavibacteriales bacterium]|nr:MAG: hypothetical protein EHM47_12990 [Ignavibacteriales bacterium]
MYPENLIVEVEKFSDHKLKRKDDLQILIETSLALEKMKDIESLSFSAKYILGLQRVLQKGSINPEIGNLEKIKKDYSDNLKKVIEQIKEFLKLNPENIRAHFDQTYLELSHQSLYNLNELLEDLEWYKMYLNSLKRQL